MSLSQTPSWGNNNRYSFCSHAWVVIMFECLIETLIIALGDFLHFNPDIMSTYLITNEMFDNWP